MGKELEQGAQGALRGTETLIHFLIIWRISLLGNDNRRIRYHPDTIQPAAAYGMIFYEGAFDMSQIIAMQPVFF